MENTSSLIGKPRVWTKTKHRSGRGRICPSCNMDMPTAAHVTDFKTGRPALMDDNDETESLLHIYTCTKNLSMDDIIENRKKWLSNQSWLRTVGQEIYESTGKYVSDTNILKEIIRKKGVWYEYKDLKKVSTGVKDHRIIKTEVIEEYGKLSEVKVNRDSLLGYIAVLEKIQGDIDEAINFLKKTVGIEQH